ncbi:MAG: hypothetical protein KTR32_32790 [Granulosicoccus sp.]|nr:hypothetical protein [Granulosicoccus sp.]
MSDDNPGRRLPKLPRMQLSSPLQLSEKQELIKIIGNRLFVVLFIFLILMVGWSAYVFLSDGTRMGSLPAVLFTGILGGVIGLQNRLKTLGSDDLLLLSKSNMYVMLAPLVGGFLSVLLYILFISGLLEGQLFPKFDADKNTDSESLGIASLFNIHGASHQDYGKLIFWCFIAGFSERFVTNIISRFEGAADSQQPVGQSAIQAVDGETKNNQDADGG